MKYQLNFFVWRLTLCRYYKIMEADHIFFIVNRKRAGVQFDLLYDGIFERCRKHVLRNIHQPVLPNQDQ